MFTKAVLDFSSYSFRMILFTLSQL